MSNQQDFGLRCISYTSRVEHDWSATELADLGDAAAAINQTLGITGRLLYLERRFIQVIEGPAEQLRRLYVSIRRDPRHLDVLTLLDTAVPARSFPDWAMDLIGQGDLAAGDIARAEALFGRLSSPEAATAGSEAHALLVGIAPSFLQRSIRFTPRQTRAKARLDQLLAATQTILAAQGIGAVTLKAVAAVARMEVKTAYRYFASADDLLRLLVRREQSRQFALLTSQIETTRFTSLDAAAHHIVGHLIQRGLTAIELPARVQAELLRDYHDTPYGELRAFAGVALQMLARDGLYQPQPASEAHLAGALAAISGAAKMAALGDIAALSDPSFHQRMTTTLLAALADQD